MRQRVALGQTTRALQCSSLVRVLVEGVSRFYTVIVWADIVNYLNRSDEWKCHDLDKPLTVVALQRVEVANVIRLIT